MIDTREDFVERNEAFIVEPLNGKASGAASV
jgi:hypothetical protein